MKSFSSAATSSVREASGTTSNEGAPSASSSASSVPGRLAAQAVSIGSLRQMHGSVYYYDVLVERGYVERGRSKARYALFAAGVPVVNSSQAQTFIRGELQHVPTS